MSDVPDEDEVEERVRKLMKDHERLLDVVVVDETDQGYYALVIRDWDHPSDHVDGGMLSERFAYLTKGDGGDGWVLEQDAAAINRRDVHGDGALAAKLATAYAKAAARQRAGSDDVEPHLDSLVDMED